MTQGMTHREPFAGPEYPAWWTVSTSWEWQGKPVRQGTRLKISGERGAVFEFVNHTIAPPRPGSGKRKTQEWITVIGGSVRSGERVTRSFRPDRVTSVMPPGSRPASRSGETGRAPRR
jgi:hypothetical protein